MDREKDCLHMYIGPIDWTVSGLKIKIMCPQFGLLYFAKRNETETETKQGF